MVKCGKLQCACASDAAKRHGPHFELTYKANGKTVNIKLSLRYHKPNWQRPNARTDSKTGKTGAIPISPV
jgi:hypothetical protein